MKLFTHNILKCNKKGVKEGFPLQIEASKVEVQKTDYNEDFVKGIFRRVHWGALREAAHTLKCGLLPEKVTPEMLKDPKFLQQLHHVLLEVVVLEGFLVCPESGRKFPIQKGIPNMLLNEDEI